MPTSIKELWSQLKPWGRWTHAIVWIGLAIWVNIPALDFTIGIFQGRDYSLLLPTVYGLPINIFIFYGTACLVGKLLRETPGLFLLISMLLLAGTSLVEALFDIGYYIYFYGAISGEFMREAIYGPFIMNGILFYLSSLVFGAIIGWRSEQRPPEKIHVNNGHEKVYLDPQDLRYIESEGNYAVFHTQDHKILERISLTDLERRLPDQFVRCHKSYIVNQMLIAKMSASEVWIAGDKIPIGRKYKDNLRSRL